jgi:TPR repeat protein
MAFFSKLFGGGELGALRKAAIKGDADAQSELGSKYRFGEGVQRDDYEAFQWYAKAAIQGHMFAQFYLGIMYATGQGIQKDRNKAIALLQNAAAHGIPNAEQALQEAISMRD